MGSLGPPSNASYLLPIIRELKLDEKHGVKLAPILFPDPSNLYADFASHRIEVTVGAYFNAASFYSKGVRMQLLFTLSTANHAIVAKDKAILAPEHLKGRTMAATTSSGFYALALIYLRQNGLDPRRSLNVIAGAPAAVQTQLFAGKVDAGLLAEPLLSNALQNGYHVVGDMTGDIRKDLKLRPDAPVWYLGIFAWRDWIEADPRRAEALLRIWQEAAAWYDAEPAAADRLVADYAKLPPEALKLSRENGFSTFKVVPANTEKANIGALLDGFKSVGFLPELPDDGLYYAWPGLK